MRNRNRASFAFTMANLVMNTLLDKLLLTLPFVVSFIFFKYIDDFIIVVPAMKTDYILMHFNKYYKRLQFTIEVEKNIKMRSWIAN